MDLAAGLDYARTHRRCVLVTLKADGRPQSSNVMQWTDAEGVIRVSLTADRAKTRNLVRDPRVSLHCCLTTTSGPTSCSRGRPTSRRSPRTRTTPPSTSS